MQNIYTKLTLRPRSYKQELNCGNLLSQTNYRKNFIRPKITNHLAKNSFRKYFRTFSTKNMKKN